MTTPASVPPERPQPVLPVEAPSATLPQVVRAVLWSFFGIRKGKDMQRDAASIKPLHVLIVALLSALAFVLALVGLVAFITRAV